MQHVTFRISSHSEDFLVYHNFRIPKSLEFDYNNPPRSRISLGVACQSGLRLIESLATCSGVRVARDRHIKDHQGPGLLTRPRRTQRALQPQP